MAHWTCFKCGKRGRGAIDKLTDEGWGGFDLRYKFKGIRSKRIRKFACPEHKEELVTISTDTWKAIEEGKDPLQRGEGHGGP